MTAMPDKAFKILSKMDWQDLLDQGSYQGSDVDLADGYIHLSAPDQLEGTAAKHYSGLSDLVLVEVDLTTLGDTLIWETSRGGALFPHIYGSLPLSATREARALEVTSEGQMILGEINLAPSA